ncbi:hypothetical protein K7X08_020945 [Anisodus acutangulus]|uniref:Uncharacterized protein n=1 Tax=Anisodus acutangulus TaxID=402998 RepID=A0A9Q1MTT8_9SOLA|nr:hypothetical protein K7X08_020945 [Anisodus acutangulus]
MVENIKERNKNGQSLKCFQLSNKICHRANSGLHVALTMFTGYLVGYYAFRALFCHSPAMSAAGGILGLVIGMLVETLLFIIRTSSMDKIPARKATSFTTKQKKDQ